jgi:hypothetical protein
VTATNLQTAAMTVSAVLIPVAFAGGNWISRSNFWGILFVVVLYGSVLAAVVSTFVRYRKEQRSCLAKWRRIPYEIGLFLLLVLSLCPIATWTLALRGAAPEWSKRTGAGPHFLVLAATLPKRMGHSRLPVRYWFSPPMCHSAVLPPVIYHGCCCRCCLGRSVILCTPLLPTSGSAPRLAPELV